MEFKRLDLNIIACETHIVGSSELPKCRKCLNIDVEHYFYEWNLMPAVIIINSVEKFIFIWAFVEAFPFDFIKIRTVVSVYCLNINYVTNDTQHVTCESIKIWNKCKRETRSHHSTMCNPVKCAWFCATPLIPRFVLISIWPKWASKVGSLFVQLKQIHLFEYFWPNLFNSKMHNDVRPLSVRNRFQCEDCSVRIVRWFPEAVLKKIIIIRRWKQISTNWMRQPF